MDTRRFGRGRRGGGVFSCCVCGHLTRNTHADGGNASVRMCPGCFAISLRTNTYLDNPEFGHEDDAERQATLEWDEGRLDFDGGLTVAGQFRKGFKPDLSKDFACPGCGQTFVFRIQAGRGNVAPSVRHAPECTLTREAETRLVKRAVKARETAFLANRAAQ